MTKVLQINIVANWGSTGRIAEQIGEKVIARGWESYIAYGRWKNPSKSRLLKIGFSWEHRLHHHLSKFTDKHGLYSSWATRRFIRKIKKIKPDIVHLHNIHGAYINYKVLFSYLRKANIPVVWTLHDCWAMTGHCAYFDFANCNRWQSGCYDCPQLGSYPKSKIDNSCNNYKIKQETFSSLANQLHLVPVSSWLANVVRHSFLKDSSPFVIHNGIHVDEFYPHDIATLHKKYDIAEKYVILGVASPWSKRKGLQDFYKLHNLLPQNKYQIVLIGLNQQQISDLPMDIIALQQTSSVEELAEWYSAANVFVNPTYEDTYPTTNLESISCGTPVVTYRTGGSPESVTINTGRVVEQGDVEGVVKAIEELCAEDRDTMRKRCREYALEHFDRDKNYDKYIDLYENIIKTQI